MTPDYSMNWIFLALSALIWIPVAISVSPRIAQWRFNKKMKELKEANKHG